MYIIVGLGNPGREYEHTRHNTGFDTVSVLARQLEISLNKRECKAVTGRGQIGGEPVVLALPQTYMNLSGESVRELLSWYKCEPDHLIVCYDDIDLDLGRVRVRGKGSAGTHNGMRNIIYLLGRDDFPRVRVGVGKPDPRWSLADYVLSRYETEEQKSAMAEAMGLAARAVRLIVTDGVEAATRLTSAAPGGEKKQERPRYSFAALAAELSGRVGEGQFPGAACAVAKDGRTLYQGMFGLTERGAKMRKDVIWPLGGLTMPVTAACALMLCDRGKLSLEDPVADYLPDFERMMVCTRDGEDRVTGREPAGKLITVEDALRLRTGMGQCGYARSEWEKVCSALPTEDREDLTQRARWMSRVPLSARPGERAGDDPRMAYDLLAALCEAASGMRFATLLDVEIFAPLGMGDTGYVLSDGQRERLAFGEGEKWESGAEGLYGTAPAYLRFLNMAAMGGSLGGARVLSEASARALCGGLGMTADGRAESGFGARAWVDLSGAACGVCLARCGGETAPALQDAVARHVADALRAAETE